MALNINGTTGISGVDGSATAPALKGVDSNTGVSFGTDIVNLVTGGTTRATVHSSGRVSIGTSSADASLHIKSPDGSNGRLILEQTLDAANYQNGIDFKNAGTQYAGIVAGKDGSNNSLGLVFHTGASFTERMRINSGGEVGINKTASGVTLDVEAINNTHALRASGSQANYASFLCDNSASSGTRNFISFRINNSEKGKITSTGSSTVYATSSDYRLKENIVAISDGITRLKTLQPKRFNFIIDETNTLVDGFLAHEVTAVPEAITGTKDEVDSDNNPVYQGIDQSKLVPLLTAALQEAIAKIEVLETKVAALEAA